MSRFDTGSLRQLFDHLGIEPLYIMPSLAAWQIQEHDPQENLPAALAVSVDRLRDLAVMSRNYLQIGVFEFFVGLDFLQGKRTTEAVQYFETAKRQWLFIDHLPLISLAHLAMGMAHHAAGEYRQAAAAYFKVKQCLQQAEMEPYRLEKIEAERSLQSFWNDLERVLMMATNSLRRDFDMEQEDRLKSGLGTVADEAPDDESGEDNASNLTLNMRPVRAMSAADVNDLIGRTVDGIEILNAALIPPGELDSRPPLTITRISYADQGEVTLELSNVSMHAVAFCRWLMTTIPTETQPAGTPTEQPAEDAEGSPGGPQPREDDSSPAWFKLQVRSGQVGKLIKAYVKSVTGREPEAHEIERLIQVVGHLAELRTNYQLTLT